MVDGEDTTVVGRFLERLEAEGTVALGRAGGALRLARGTVPAQLVTLAAVSVLALLPPVAVVVAMQRWFVRGLVDAEK